MFLSELLHWFAADVWRYVLLAVGLGFVVFFHELGHFLAAKYCGVRVEQFALGFGPAMVAWRKGIGLQRGTTVPTVEKKIEAYWQSHRLESHRDDQPLTATQVERAMAAQGLGETEYRFNWIPLGGYVKMLGQDDLHPEAVSSEPRSYNSQSIRGRMLIISAGVLMNVLLAAIGFMIVYLMGLASPPAEVGGVLTDSPASFAQADDGTRSPLQVGDQIVSINGSIQREFANVALTVALAPEGRPLNLVVRRHDGMVQTLHVTPIRSAGDGLLSMGVLPPEELRAPEASDVDKTEDELANPDLFSSDMRAVGPGESITAINGTPVDVAAAAEGKASAADDYWRLDAATADSDGRPIVLTVRAADGSTRNVQIQPHFQSPFSAEEDVNLAGMMPRVRVAALTANSPAVGKVHPGDVIEAVIQVGNRAGVTDPSPSILREAINEAGQRNQPIILTIAGSGQTPPIVPSIPLSDDRRGLSIQLGCDEQHAVVADVAGGSAADKAGIKPGWRLTKIDGAGMSNWFEVRRALAGLAAGQAVAVEAQTPDGKSVAVNLVPSQDEIDAAKFLPFTTDLASVLRERTVLRKTGNPLIAAAWGVTETRNFILQFYVMLRRMISGSVSYKNAMGPVGIVHFGAMSAARGTNWLIWFLAMISADLAVANFLPIPVMDGGVFLMLIIEAIQGKPLSMKAQQINQMIGLALILGVFLLVTYQDIARLFGHG
jgi:regulator of sigma E protease